jgi:quinolinate synthase
MSTKSLIQWTPDALFEKLKRVKTDNKLCEYTLARCERLCPLINRITELKQERNAVILAHSYVHPDVIYGVADHVGDSYGLAQKAMQTDASTIVFPSVRFMAETAKILNPDKLVIDPNPNGGCSLADSITAEDVLRLRDQFPDHTFICYINTTAAVKAACDICVTSSNVYHIVATCPNDKIFFLPDLLMGKNLIAHLKESGIEKEIQLWDGTCYVHEEFSPEHAQHIRKQYPNVSVLAHPECSPAVIEHADVVGSTSQMVQHVKKHAKDGSPFMLLTECGLVSRLQVEHPEVQLVGNCMMCKYMKSNNLENLERALRAPRPEEIIEFDNKTREGALKCLEAMFKMSKN